MALFKSRKALVSDLEQVAGTAPEIRTPFQQALRRFRRNKIARIGLFLLVAIPLPGTGAWTGALVASFLDMRLMRAIPIILFGVMAAGGLMVLLSHGVFNVMI